MRTARNEHGAAAVELVLLLPAFLALVGLVLMAGWLGLIRVVLDHGAREGLRVASIPVGDDLRSWPTPAEVGAAVEAATPLISPTSVTSSGAGPNPTGNEPLEVTVVYEVSNPVAVLLAPLAAIGLDQIVNPDIRIVSRAGGRRE